MCLLHDGHGIVHKPLSKPHLVAHVINFVVVVVVAAAVVGGAVVGGIGIVFAAAVVVVFAAAAVVVAVEGRRDSMGRRGSFHDFGTNGEAGVVVVVVVVVAIAITIAITIIGGVGGVLIVVTRGLDELCLGAYN